MTITARENFAFSGGCMTSNVAMEILRKVDALITDSHIVYTSGRHGNAYINKDALYVHTVDTSSLCRLIAENYKAENIDVVAGPTVGGVILAQWVAYHLTEKKSKDEVISIYAEESGEGDNKVRIFKRGYDAHVPGKNVLVVEDILTTGGSARKVVEAVRSLGGNVVGLSVICNRGGVTGEMVGGVPIHALTTITLDSYEAGECPLCKENVPVNTSVGKGKEYLKQKQSSAR